MTKFNPENKKELTMGEIAEPAMKITSQADADQYLIAYIMFASEQKDASMFNLLLKRQLKKTADICKETLAYFAGYYDHATRARVEKLFKCSHPVFGSIKDGVPTGEEAFQLGMNVSTKKGPQTLKEMRGTRVNPKNKKKIN